MRCGQVCFPESRNYDTLDRLGTNGYLASWGCSRSPHPPNPVLDRVVQGAVLS
jgi:hypothetical protein